MTPPATTPAPQRAKPAHHWTDTVNELQARIAAGSTPAPNLTELAIGDLEIIDAVFQHRSGNQAGSGQHIDSLVKSLRNRKGVALDPIVVFWVGDGWVLIDGHHRVDAYAEHGRSEPVPVRVFKGTLDEAICEALRGNSRDKLSMGRRDSNIPNRREFDYIEGYYLQDEQSTGRDTSEVARDQTRQPLMGGRSELQRTSFA